MEYSQKIFSAGGSYIPLKERNKNEARQLYGDNWCTLRGSSFKDLLDLGANRQGLPKHCQCYKI